MSAEAPRDWVADLAEIERLRAELAAAVEENDRLRLNAEQVRFKLRVTHDLMTTMLARLEAVS